MVFFSLYHMQKTSNEVLITVRLNTESLDLFRTVLLSSTWTSSTALWYPYSFVSRP